MGGEFSFPEYPEFLFPWWIYINESEQAALCLVEEWSESGQGSKILHEKVSIEEIREDNFQS